MLNALAIVGAVALSLLLAVACYEGIIRPFRRLRRDARRWRALEDARRAARYAYDSDQETLEESYNKAREVA